LPALPNTAFNAALDLHCREASRIIKEFAGGWYGKTLQHERRITQEEARKFAHVAFKKLRAELRSGATPVPERLVLCGGAKRGGEDSTLRLALAGSRQNVTLKLEDIAKRLLNNIPDLLVDLVEIASCVYCADQATGRGGAAQVGMGSAWRRSFRFVIPVRHPNHWNRKAVLEPLCDALFDDYLFEFEEAPDPTPLETYLELSGDDPGFKADEVLLFSGGLDSLAGAVEELSTSRKNVALVSHRSSPKIFDHQKQLVADLRKRFPKRVMHFPVQVTRQESLRVQEYTQRTRSFLYMALACVVARMFGSTRARFFENGVVSINLPISDQVVGARATRSTHPVALERFRRFLGAAIGQPIGLENPFIWKTKADVIRSIVAGGCGPLIKYTVSCTRVYEMTKLHTHCGCCSQCLDRRFAVLRAGAGEHDPVEMYKVELLTGARDKPSDQTMAESYVRTAVELCDMGEFAFFDRYTGETARVCAGFPRMKPDDVAREVLNLHHRHGRAICDVLKSAVQDYSADLVNRSLPASSVLIMAVVPGETPAIASGGKRDDPFQILIEDEMETATARQYAPEASAITPKGRKRGQKPRKFEQAKEAMRRDIESGQHTADSLHRTLEKTLAEVYGVSRDTARRARTAILSEFVENSKATNDK
jgi:hypothetical protein